MSLKKNVIANYFGQGWSALMGLAFVPLYIKYLGMEAFGLIGLFAMLQAWLTLFDMGMTPTISREMSRFKGGAYTLQSIRNLLYSIELICILISVFIAIGVWLASGWLATDWLRAEKLPVETVAQAFSVMGVVTALRFMEGFYHGAIVGLQRQILLNVVNSFMATVRGIGAVILLVFVSPTISVFFIWQAVVSLITVAIFIIVLRKSLPPLEDKPEFSQSVLTDIWRFAAGMMGLTFLSLLLMQIDKVILSKMLSLEAFGHYSLVGVVTSGLYYITGPITQAYYPYITELVTRKDESGLIAVYHRGSQILTVLVGTAAMMLMFFGERIMLLWTGNSTLANDVAPLLAVLTFGTLLHNMLHMPYILQLAYGYTRLSIYSNIVAVILLVPAVLWVVPLYGAIGAAWIWGILNLGYMFISMHFLHIRFIPGEKWSWYVMDIGLPLAAAALTSFVFRCLQPLTSSKPMELSWLFVVGIVTAVSSLFAARDLRCLLILSWRSR